MRWLVLYVIVEFSLASLGEFYLSLYLLQGGLEKNNHSKSLLGSNSNLVNWFKSMGYTKEIL